MTERSSRLPERATASEVLSISNELAVESRVVGRFGDFIFFESRVEAGGGQHFFSFSSRGSRLAAAGMARRLTARLADGAAQ